MSADERARAVLDIARRIADPTDPLGARARRELAGGGLSPQGIELALTDHLERDATRAEIEALCRSASSTPEPRRVFVVLAGTVCVAAVRAIALALAASPHVVVKPSRRDPTIASILVDALAAPLAELGGSIAAVPSLGAVAREDAVHAYGSDATLSAIRSSLPSGVLFWPHGTGVGLAFVSTADALPHATEAIARDVVPFDQRGCLSPRVVLVEGDAVRVRAFASGLDVALATLGRRVPRGVLTVDEHADVERYVALMRASGEVFRGSDHVVALDPEPSALWLGPACRVVHVVPVSASSLERLVAPLAQGVAALGFNVGSELAQALRTECPGARPSLPGHMQQPKFDGPVDLRTRAATI